jgi:hypothetical protein
VEGLLSRPSIRNRRFCGNCGLEGPTKQHFRHLVKRPNPCELAGTVTRNVPVDEFYRLNPWKISKLGLLDYQRVVKHQPVHDRRTKKLTFDETALLKLMKRYPKDELYPLVLDFRGNQKLLTVYIGQTKYTEVEVPNDYVLQPGEKLAKD